VRTLRRREEGQGEGGEGERHGADRNGGGALSAHQPRVRSGPARDGTSHPEHRRPGDGSGRDATERHFLVGAFEGPQAAEDDGQADDDGETRAVPGQVGPFALLSYDDARRHSAMIAEVVDTDRLPGLLRQLVGEPRQPRPHEGGLLRRTDMGRDDDRLDRLH